MLMFNKTKHTQEYILWMAYERVDNRFDSFNFLLSSEH